MSQARVRHVETVGPDGDRPRLKRVESFRSVLAGDANNPPPASVNDQCAREASQTYNRVTDDPFEGYEDLVAEGLEEWFIDAALAQKSAGSMCIRRGWVTDRQASIDSLVSTTLTSQ